MERTKIRMHGNGSKKGFYRGLPRLRVRRSIIAEPPHSTVVYRIDTYEFEPVTKGRAKNGTLLSKFQINFYL